MLFRVHFIIKRALQVGPKIFLPDQNPYFTDVQKQQPLGHKP